MENQEQISGNSKKLDGHELTESFREVTKEFFGDSDTFTAYITIDAGMFMLCEISNKNGANWNWDTGEGTQIRVTEDDAEQVEVILVDIIQAQKFIGQDATENEDFLVKVREMIANKKGGQ